MPRCLIVDDDRDGREGFAEYLRAFGFEVDECVDAESVWRHLSRRPPDVILLDLQLPRLSGWELMKQLRRTQEYAEMPVVAFSACAFPDDRDRAAEVGCNVFIAKPAAPGDVLAELNKLLSSKLHGQPAGGTPDASS